MAVARPRRAEPLGVAMTFEERRGKDAAGPVGEAALEPELAAAAEPQAADDGGTPGREGVLIEALAAAEARGDHLQLTQDGIVLSHLLIARGATAEAKALLTKTAMVATRAKLAEQNAAARIELAEIAREEGDMTTACEHWQLAKQLFHEIDRKADAQRMGDKLRLNHCPTDWFLTGF